MFSKESLFFKTWIFESGHQTPRRRTKKEFPTKWLCPKELNKKREEIKKGDQKEQQKKCRQKINK